MTGLIRAEVLRLRSRRFTWIALLALFLAVGAFQIQVASELRAPSEAAVAELRAAYQEQHDEWALHHDEWAADCRETGDAEGCEMPEPQLADFLPERSFRGIAELSVSLTSFLVGLGLFFVAVSFIGAEYSSGAIGNWLTFVPRRNRVYAAKLIAICGFAAVAGAAYLAATVGAAVVFARIGAVPLTGLNQVLATAGRGVAVPVALAAIGFAIGLLTRHTAGGIGVLLGYLAVWFVRNVVLMNQAWAQKLSPWLPEGNLLAVVQRGSTYYVPAPRTPTSDGFADSIELHISVWHGAGYLAALVAVFVLVAALVFRRRDVT